MVLLQALFHTMGFGWECDKGSADNTLNLLILRAPSIHCIVLGKHFHSTGAF